jgi:hypothetical protein
VVNGRPSANTFGVLEGTYNGLTTTRVPDPAPYFTSKNNRFQANSYDVPNLSGRYWVWDSGLRVWTEWQAAGQDTTGAVE